LQLRVGIHTGPVLLGTLQTTGEYTALGDSVNVASRLEHAAPPGGILISQATYRQVQGIFEAELLPPLSVKGKAEPLQAYRVSGVLPGARRTPARGVAGVETPTIGRAAEFELLKACFARAQGGAELVLIVAEAGGRVTGTDGAPFASRAGHVLASNGYVHDEMLGVIRDFRGHSQR
jgi:hypothetical protein